MRLITSFDHPPDFLGGRTAPFGHDTSSGPRPRPAHNGSHNRIRVSSRARRHCIGRIRSGTALADPHTDPGPDSALEALVRGDRRERVPLDELFVQRQQASFGHESVPGLRFRRQQHQGGRGRARPPEGCFESGRSGLSSRRGGRRLDPAGLGRGRALPRRQRQSTGLRPPAGFRQLRRPDRQRPAFRRREVRDEPRLRAHRRIRRLQRQRAPDPSASGTRSPSPTWGSRRRTRSPTSSRPC